MSKATGKYQRLRRRLREYDIDQRYLAELLKRSPGHISNCLTGKSDWQMQEVYTIIKLCQIPVGEIYKYFPPGGIDKEFESKPDSVNQFAIELAGLLQNYFNKEAAKI